MTPEELAASKWYAKTLIEQSKDRILDMKEVHIVDLAAEVDRLRAELATAKADALAEAVERIHQFANNTADPTHKLAITRSAQIVNRYADKYRSAR